MSPALAGGFFTTKMPSYLPPKEGPYMDPSQNWQDSEKFSRKLPLIIPLNSQEEAKTKTNGKFC